MKEVSSFLITLRQNRIYMYRFILVLLIFTMFSCATGKQARKTYIGQSVAELKEKFGEPKTVFDKENEKIYVFEVLKELESTEISQGKLTLDPIVTPPVKKTERYYFTVKNDVVVKTKFEEEYER